MLRIEVIKSAASIDVTAANEWTYDDHDYDPDDVWQWRLSQVAVMIMMIAMISKPANKGTQWHEKQSPSASAVPKWLKQYN